MHRIPAPLALVVAGLSILPGAATAAPGDTLADLIIVNRNSGGCVAVSGPTTTPGTPVVQWRCWASAGQTFDRVETAAGFKIVDRNSGLCLGVANRSTRAGAAITIETCADSPSQTWTALPRGGDDAGLKNAKSGLCMAADRGSRDDGAALVQTTCAASAEQTWVASGKAGPSVWTDVIPLPLPPVASAILPNGKVLIWSARNRRSYGYGEIGRTYTAVFNPVTLKSSERLVQNTNHEMFCPGTSVLPDGRILVNGGSSSARTSIYDPKTNSWVADRDMAVPRGYQANTVLDNGDVFTLGGSWSGGLGHRIGEVWSTAGGWRTLKNVDGDALSGPDPGGIYRADNHMWLFGVSGGMVFHAGPAADMNWIDTAGDGKVTAAGKRDDDAYSINGGVVMYEAGKILKVGGAPGYSSGLATASAYTIDFSKGPSKPVVVEKVKPLAIQRTFTNAVVLPNGQVVVVGGRTDASTAGDATAVMIPEIWTPQTKSFTRLEPISVPRQYHASALLLTDGRVFVGGGGVCTTCPNHPDAQILTPSYLLDAAGNLASRPKITKANATAKIGGTLKATTSRLVKSWAIVRLSASTHSINNDQRRVVLKVAGRTGRDYDLAIPADRGTVTPGNWMLFALDSKGVPSVAKIVNIR